MHICVSKLTIIGSDYGLSPGHYLNQCWNIVKTNLRNKIQWNLNLNSYILFRKNTFENVLWKMGAILSQPQWINKHMRRYPELAHPKSAHDAQLIEEISINSNEMYGYTSIRICSWLLTNTISDVWITIYNATRCGENNDKGHIRSYEIAFPSVINNCSLWGQRKGVLTNNETFYFQEAGMMSPLNRLVSKFNDVWSLYIKVYTHVILSKRRVFRPRYTIAFCAWQNANSLEPVLLI